MEIRLALDASSARSWDKDGRLHVAPCNISKANVCPYFGSEILGAQALGLAPERVYMLWRHPEELERAASTFNNLPLLSEHVMVTAAAPRPELVIGSVGTDAAFVAPFLQNSIVVWDPTAINRIMRATQEGGTHFEGAGARELSCGYYYRADMTPGVVDGVAYDGIMRDIIGSHVALVAQGRAGSDVGVADAQIRRRRRLRGRLTIHKENQHMPTLLTPRGAAIAGAVNAYGLCHLAQDKALPNMRALFAGITSENWPSRRLSVLAAARSALQPVIAADVDIDDLNVLIDKLDEPGGVETTDAEQPEMVGAEAPAKASDDTIADQLRALLAGKLEPEIVERIIALASGQAADADEPDKDKDEDKGSVSKAAMDAAIASAVAQATKALREANSATLEAIATVRPVVGELNPALDTAGAVYKAGLGFLGVDTTNLPEAAYRATFLAVAANRSKAHDAMPHKPAVGPSSSGAAAFAAAIPGAAKAARPRTL